MWHNWDGAGLDPTCRKLAKIKGCGLKPSNFSLISSFPSLPNPLGAQPEETLAVEDVLKGGLWMWHGAGRRFPSPIWNDEEV